MDSFPASVTLYTPGDRPHDSGVAYWIVEANSFVPGGTATISPLMSEPKIKRISKKKQFSKSCII
jgi:hypothetical protein